jgi:hypothetical protein
MKMIKWIICVSISISTLSFGQDYRGYFYLQSTAEFDGVSPEIDTAKLKLWQDITEEGGLYLEINTRKTGNEIDQAYFYQKDVADGEIRIGRIFVAAPFGTPAPQYTAVARYPRSALSYNFYAYGVQYVRDLDENWCLMADVSGNSSVTYDSDDIFDRTEGSFRLKRKVSNGFVAVGSQAYDQTINSSVDFEQNLGRTGVYGAVYYSNLDSNDNLFSGFCWITYSITDWLTPHVQLDMRPDGDNVATAGVMVGTYERFSLIADYELNGPDQGFVARAQVRYDF